MAELLYQGKTKEMWTTDDPEVLRAVYKDDATALDGLKHDVFQNKGELDAEISSLVFEYLMKHGVKTHFIKRLSKNEQLVKKVKMIDLEVVTRNIAAGSFCKRYGLKEEGEKLDTPVEELCMKSDALHDPRMNESDAIAFHLLTHEEHEQIWEISRQVNQLLTKLFADAGMLLVDFKVEFGTLPNGEVVLADEFSPDNCRLWDMETKDHMDKDVYRRQIGNLIDVYERVLARLKDALAKED